MKRQRPENETLKRRYDDLRALPGVDNQQSESIRNELSKLDGDKRYISYSDLRTRDLERREKQ